MVVLVPQAEDVAELMQDGPVFRVGEMHGGLVFGTPRLSRPTFEE